MPMMPRIGDGEDDRDRGGKGHRIAAGGDEVNQDHQRQKQIGALEQTLEHGQLFLVDALETELFRLQVDGDEDAGEVQNGRQDRADDDARIGDAHILRHQEGGGAHDRGHDLSAGRGGCLNSAGKLALIAGLLHHRDRDRAGRDRVADRRAGHHAAQRGGDDRDLGRTAGKAADKGVGQIDEELGDAGALQKRAEDDEDDDEFRADLHGGVEQSAALHLVKQADGDVAHGARHAEIFPYAVVVQRIDEKHARHAQDRDADAAAAELEHRHDADDADHDLIAADLGHAQTHGQILGVHNDVNEGGGAEHHQDPVIPGDIIDLLHALFHREVEIADQQHTAEERRIADQIQPGGEERDVDHEQRKSRHDRVHDPFLPALPYAGVGFAVIFFHDLVHGRLIERGVLLGYSFIDC